MAQVIAPEIWQEGIRDNSMLPGRYTTGLFTGNGVKIANNGEACRVWDIQVTDYITDYDDRRLNGLGNGTTTGFNQDGRDGWGASAYGVFQDVRFDSRVYTMGRHRSIAMRLFDEMQYSGGIGQWGTETASNVITPGQNLMKTAALISRAKDIWEKEVLGPDIDKYNLFAVCNGHISGRWVAVTPAGVNYTDQVMDGDASHGQWVAQPGMVEGEAIPPRFAPIHGIEWDDQNIAMMLQTIKVTWNNMFIPQDNRVIVIDPYYEYKLLFALTGNGIPATEKAYADMQNGSFTRLMGWDFNFEIPSHYWPKLYVDANMNVVHSATGMACDATINSVAGTPGSPDKLLIELLEANRQQQLNYVRTVFNPTTHKFEKVVTNYALGMPSANPYKTVFGSTVNAEVVSQNLYASVDANGNAAASDVYNSKHGDGQEYPFAGPGAGYGIAAPTGPDGNIELKQVIGLAVYRPAAQLSQEYSEMVTDEGRTRGKFTEMCMDVKYDAWVIEQYSHGILPIFAESPATGDPKWGIPVRVVEEPSA